MTGSRNRLRIIGGAWRGRTLAFPPLPGLRPTPDRVRETLFNWLRDVIAGARCLDLFAGSGVLGLESLSRGAAAAVLVDRQPEAVAALRRHIATLNAGATAVCADAIEFLRQPPEQPYDVVFLDPPFHDDILNRCLALLAAPGWLAGDAWIYVEADRATPLPPLPAHWQLFRHKQAGQVGYHLLHCAAASAAERSGS